MKVPCDRCGLPFKPAFLRVERKGATTLHVCRDCYDVAHSTTVKHSPVFVSNQYVKDPYDRVVVDTEDRIFRAITVGLYPLILEVERLNTAMSDIGASLRPVVFEPPVDVEVLTTGISINGITLRDSVSTHQLYDVEGLTTALSIGAITLRDTLIQHQLYDVEPLTTTISIGTVTLKVTLTDHTVYDIENLTTTLSNISVTLV